MFNEDVRDITHISDIGRLKILADKIIHMAGGVVNYSNIAGDLQVSVDTVRRWFDVLESIYFCFRLHPYAKNINKAIRKEPKVYLWDWSLIKDQGGRNENFIACHLLKYVHYITDTGIGNANLHYVRDKNKREIDFLITREDIPWVCLEVKSGDKNISPSLYYFKQTTGSEHGFQLVFNKPFVNADCFKETKPVKVPVSTFLSQLV
jgi:predicted AAA+ superfamily ATPase